jgi:hypothetical protein
MFRCFLSFLFRPLKRRQATAVASCGQTPKVQTCGRLRKRSDGDLIHDKRASTIKFFLYPLKLSFFVFMFMRFTCRQTNQKHECGFKMTTLVKMTSSNKREKYLVTDVTSRPGNTKLDIGLYASSS